MGHPQADENVTPPDGRRLLGRQTGGDLGGRLPGPAGPQIAQPQHVLGEPIFGPEAGGFSEVFHRIQIAALTERPDSLYEGQIEVCEIRPLAEAKSWDEEKQDATANRQPIYRAAHIAIDR